MTIFSEKKKPSASAIIDTYSNSYMEFMRLGDEAMANKDFSTAKQYYQMAADLSAGVKDTIVAASNIEVAEINRKATRESSLIKTTGFLFGAVLVNALEKEGNISNHQFSLLSKQV